MRASAFVGRVGGLAAALGIGVLAAGGAGAAWAAPGASAAESSDGVDVGGTPRSNATPQARTGREARDTADLRGAGRASVASARIADEPPTPPVQRNRQSRGALAQPSVQGQAVDAEVLRPTIEADETTASAPAGANVIPAATVPASAAIRPATVTWTAPAVAAPAIAATPPQPAPATGLLGTELAPWSGSDPLAPAGAAISMAMLAATRRETASAQAATPPAATVTTGHTVAPAATAVVNNAASPVVSLSPGSVTVVEGNAGIVSKVTFTVALADGAKAASDVKVLYTTSGSGAAPATEDVDYASGPREVTIYKGNNSAMFLVDVRGDSVTEPDETFTVTLTFADGATLGTAKSATVKIANDDAAAVPVVSLSPGTIKIPEGNVGNVKRVTFTVALANGATAAKDVPVFFSTSSSGTGAATASIDYTAVPKGVVRIAKGANSATFTVSVRGDDIVESDETFTVTLTEATGATLGTAKSATVTIGDDDGTGLPVVAFTTESASMSEGNFGTAGKANLTVALANGATATGNVSVKYTASSSGTDAATAGTDYPVQSGVVTIRTGANSATLTVYARGDAEAEPDETFTVTLTEVSGATLGTPKSATVKIVNDDAAVLPVVSLTTGPVRISEGNAGAVGKAYMRVALENGAVAYSDVTVNYATSSSVTAAATAGTDYTAVPNGTVTIPKGANSATIAVDVLGDNAAESDETFTVALTSATGATLGTSKSATVTIANDDTAALPVVSLTPGSVTVVEGKVGAVKTVTFKVSLANGAVAAGDVKLNYTASGSGTAKATAGTDYTAVPNGTVTIAKGTNSATFNVNVLGDADVEPAETFTVALTSAAGATLGTAKSATVTIANDDVKLPTILSTIPVGQGPVAAALNGAGTVLYVLNEKGGNVTVVDLVKSGFPSTTIPNVGVSPHGIALSPNGSRIFVTSTATREGGEPKLGVYDSTNKLVKTITFGANDYPLGVAADNARVYVASPRSDTVFSIDTTTYQVTPISMGAGSYPLQVAVASNGKVYVANGNGTVAVIVNNKVSKSLAVGGSPVGFLNSANGVLKVFDGSATSLTTINTADDTFSTSPWTQPWTGLPNSATSPNGSAVYVPAYDANAVLKISASVLSAILV